MLCVYLVVFGVVDGHHLCEDVRLEITVAVLEWRQRVDIATILACTRNQRESYC